MVQYEPVVILKFASRLYSRAHSVIASHAILGALLGALGGYSASPFIARDSPLGLSLAGAIIIGLVFFEIGREKAFKMKLEAQKILCLTAIEVNTRQSVEPTRQR